MKKRILFVLTIGIFLLILTGCSKTEGTELKEKAYVSVTTGAITTIYGTEKTEKDAHKQLIKYNAYNGDKYEVKFYCPTCGRQEIIEVEKSEQKKFKCDCIEKKYAEIKFTYKKQNKESIQEAS